MKRYLVIALLLTMLIAITIFMTLTAVLYVSQNNKNQEIDDLKAEVNTLKNNTPTPTPYDNPTPTPAAPKPSDCFNASNDYWIVVNEPCKDQIVGNTLKIKGTAFGLFENTMSVEFYDENGNKLGEESIIYTAPDLGLPGSFEKTLTIDFDSPTEKGKIKFLEYSAKDGSPAHVVEVPVRFN